MKPMMTQNQTRNTYRNYRRSMGDVMHVTALGLKNRQFNQNGAPITTQQGQGQSQGGGQGSGPGVLPQPHHPSQGKVRSRDNSKTSQRRLIAASNIYQKRYSMAATNSLKDIEQVRQQQKQEARERKRLEMIETQKQIEEMNKNQPYNTANMQSPPQSSLSSTSSTISASAPSSNESVQHPPSSSSKSQSGPVSGPVSGNNKYHGRDTYFHHNDDLKSPENSLKENEVVNGRMNTAIKKRKPKKKITYKLNGEKFVIYDYYKPTKILGKGAYAVVM